MLYFRGKNIGLCMYGHLKKCSSFSNSLLTLGNFFLEDGP